MINAELRSKLGHLSPETKEDLLTADVFGALKYLPRAYVAGVLRAALFGSARANDRNGLVGDCADCRFTFWPSYEAPDALPGGRTQPDVVLESERFLIFCEMKLHSGFGDRQIERELALAFQHAGDRQARVLVVSNGLRMPSFPGGATLTEYLRGQVARGALAARLASTLIAQAGSLHWIAWRHVRKAMWQVHEDLRAADPRSEAVARAADILHDLDKVLALRGIKDFHGLAAAVRTDAERIRFGWARIRGFDLMRPLRSAVDSIPIGWTRDVPRVAGGDGG